MLTWFKNSWVANDAAGRMSLIIFTLIGIALLVLTVGAGAVSIWNDRQDDGQLKLGSVSVIFVLALWLGRFAAEHQYAR